MIEKFFQEKYIHWIFVISLICKGILACIEVIGGLTVLFIPYSDILSYLQKIASCDVINDHNDFFTRQFRHWAADFSISAKHFAAFYLLSHGALKLWLISGLLKDKLWYFPASMVIFTLLAAYQIYRFSYTHSYLLLMTTSLDIVVIGLIWHEYRYLTIKR